VNLSGLISYPAGLKQNNILLFGKVTDDLADDNSLRYALKNNDLLDNRCRNALIGPGYRWRNTFVFERKYCP